MFQGTGCASCIESLPQRLQRIRGVESARVHDATVTVELATENRVRLEQLRDIIEQDGTRATTAVIEAHGEVSRDDTSWLFQPTGVRTNYRLVSKEQLAAGRQVVRGRITDLHPTSLVITIEVTVAQAPQINTVHPDICVDPLLSAANLHLFGRPRTHSADSLLHLLPRRYAGVG
jgi:hypothetical protein